MQGPDMTDKDAGTRLADLAGVTAEILVKKLGTFPPFGLGLDAERQKVLVTKSEDGKALLTLDTVPRRLQDELSRKRLIGSAVVACLKVASRPEESPRDTIVVQIEVPGAALVVMGRAIKKGLFGYRFGEPFIIERPIAARVFE
jgi:hypothetical protein